MSYETRVMTRRNSARFGVDGVNCFSFFVSFLLRASFIMASGSAGKMSLDRYEYSVDTGRPARGVLATSRLAARAGLCVVSKYIILK